MKSQPTFPPVFPNVRVGDRVRCKFTADQTDGRTGVAVRKLSPRRGWMVRWDEPVMGRTEGEVPTPYLELVG